MTTVPPLSLSISRPITTQLEDCFYLTAILWSRLKYGSQKTSTAVGSIIITVRFFENFNKII